MYVIFEQKRSCDQIVGDLEFELEGYFQRRLSDGYRRKVAEKVADRDELQFEGQRLNGHGESFKLEHKNVIEEARKEQLSRLQKEESDQKFHSQNKVTPKQQKHNPKSEREMLRELSDEIQNNPTVAYKEIVDAPEKNKKVKPSVEEVNEKVADQFNIQISFKSFARRSSCLFRQLHYLIISLNIHRKTSIQPNMSNWIKPTCLD